VLLQAFRQERLREVRDNASEARLLRTWLLGSDSTSVTPFLESEAGRETTAGFTGSAFGAVLRAQFTRAFLANLGLSRRRGLFDGIRFMTQLFA
jgi:hypothetical protein